MAMTAEQYDALVKLMRGSADSPGNLAARRVLVDGVSQAEAGREVGASRNGGITTHHLAIAYRKCWR